jgi:hypothetical protein
VTEDIIRELIPHRRRAGVVAAGWRIRLHETPRAALGQGSHCGLMTLHSASTAAVAAAGSDLPMVRLINRTCEHYRFVSRMRS